MNGMVMCVLLTGAALIQAVIPSSPALGQAKVPALAAIVVYYALARDRRALLWAAIGAGLIQDGMGLIPFGYSSFVFTLMGSVIARFKDIVFVHETLTHMLFGIVMAVGSTFLLYLLLTSTGLIEMYASQAMQKAFGSALLGAIATPILFRGCARMDQLMGVVESTDSKWQERV